MLQYDPEVVTGAARALIRQVTGTTLILGGIRSLRAIEEAKELRFRAHKLPCQVEIERHLSNLVVQSESPQ